ncbi:hypothetical protein BDN72DRAFT_776026 [Pluteus cervinus]|uniref:Uncharacterized protein n=1 Tax=Pluteus cervinus TaxID=181527 RepID=A0ACD3AC36_9AGAR|nr:hypothetical protein BDN72DRAFT_776026 [Pluteus cervinus]
MPDKKEASSATPSPVDVDVGVEGEGEEENSECDADDEKQGLGESSDEESENESAARRKRLQAQLPPAQQRRLTLRKILLLIGVAGMLWSFALTLKHREKKPEIIYASRYSKEHKFRPAASPIITETLKDGRIRIRGSGPTPTATPKPVPTKKKTTGRLSKGGKKMSKKHMPNKKKRY